jgi:hypothetical protein
LDSLTDSRPLLEAIQQRWGGTEDAQFAGRLFEYHLGTTFNMSAAELGQRFQAIVTEFEGVNPNPHDPADVRLIGPSGETLAEVQAKVIGETARRIHELGGERYQRLLLAVPSDHLDSAQATLAARIAQADPAFLEHSAYDDLLGRLDDRVSWHGAASEPINSDELRAAATNPDGYFRSLVDREQAGLSSQLDSAASAAVQVPLTQLLEVVGAAGAAGLSAFTASVVFASVGNAARVRAGSMAPTAAALATVTASTGALARGAYVGGVGQSVRLLAENGVLPDVLGGGSIAFVAARATWELGAIGVQLAQGRIAPDEAAARSAQSMLRIGYAYGGMVVGQALIPIPVVGALIGGAVGSVCAAVTIQGLVAARVAFRDLELSHEALSRLEAEIEAAVIVLDAETQWLRETATLWNIAFNEQVLPAVEQMTDAIIAGDFVDAVPTAAQVIRFYGQAPLFQTMAEFDEWMRDDQATLFINPNPAAPGNKQHSPRSLQR